MTASNKDEPFNKFRFKPDFTAVNGWFLLILLIGAILLGVGLIARFYF